MLHVHPHPSSTRACITMNVSASPPQSQQQSPQRLDTIASLNLSHTTGTGSPPIATRTDLGGAVVAATGGDAGGDEEGDTRLREPPGERVRGCRDEQEMCEGQRRDNVYEEHCRAHSEAA
eukprot:GHVU01138968.1.p2 GENE.GHVU01138968.1~~GHVU01138968.1.p2  ORF type:complete len:120 (+),score=15.29 GHVU01138968.1:95-454(+)